MNVRIMKCGCGGWWYANRIGEIIEVTECERFNGRFEVVNPKVLVGDKTVTSLFIEKEDCQIVDGATRDSLRDVSTLDIVNRCKSVGILVRHIVIDKKALKPAEIHIDGLFVPEKLEEK